MGSSPSRPLASAFPAPSTDELYPKDVYEQQARNTLAQIRLIPPLKRRRARSVGLSEENGTFWVYWRPGWEKERKRNNFNLHDELSTRVMQE